MDNRTFLEDHLAAVRAAASRISGHVRRTPLLAADDIGHAGDAVLVKPELLQPTGSFKVRGAFNAALALLERSPDSPGLITVSSGNHGQAVALAAIQLGLRCVVVMPEGSNPVKVAAVKALGAEVVSQGVTAQNREDRVLEVMEQTGLDLIHPFDAWDTLHGQGTAGLEVLNDCSDLGMLVAPVGGGGLISGCAIAVKASRPGVRVVGVEPELAADAQASLRAGRIVSFPAEQVSQTMADGLRTQSVGAINFEHIRAYVDDIVSVTEDEIREAMRVLGANPKTLAEPSGAVAPAAFLFHAGELPNTKINVAVISGGNIDPKLLAELRSRA